MKTYRYIGPDDLLKLVKPANKGKIISSPCDVLSWIESSGQTPDCENQVTATYVIDAENRLMVADRHSEQ